jgi:hypothetical protein
MRRVAAGILISLVAATTFDGVSRIAISQPAEPTSTPEPGLGLPPNPTYPVVEGDGIDLSTPLAEPVELPIAGYMFLAPAGATVVLRDEGGLPAIDVTTGRPVGEPIVPRTYFLISRRDSSVKIDNETGEIFQWDVRPEDSKDFEPLRHPE